jgi:hypothetical protein
MTAKVCSCVLLVEEELRSLVIGDHLRGGSCELVLRGATDG